MSGLRPSGAPRQARVKALAKINLDLRVLAKRSDGYHELRTIFQTVSLADTLDVSFTPGRKTSIELDDAAGIPDNLVTRAARAVMEASKAAGRVEMRLTKTIPMGAGLGGGSSDAASVLLALPALTGRMLPMETLCRIGQQLGSDIPFFLYGGTAVGIGRGTELFPLPDSPSHAAAIVAPGVHVSTAQAYADLSPRLTTELQENKIFSFQSLVWAGVAGAAGRNDFEAVVMEREPRLAELKRRLIRAGAQPAMMTGSGSAVFGLFRDRAEVKRALERMGDVQSYSVSLVPRSRYRSLWRRALTPHIVSDSNVWPPQSRYKR
jgi:4-diphosphocytidyl-2-C-methyl-D-erythritol kinase